jgi:GNAT superfamily N-acetyltransferase
MIRAAAELDDPEHARQLIDDIENSGRLNHLGGQAIITAHDLSSREHGGIVGMGTFQRLNEANILIEGLLVRPSHRGRHIGPAILHAAITDLVIAPEDSFTVDLPERDLRTRRFFERIGFIGDGDPHRHPEGSRGDVISHREYSGQVPFVGASVRALLGL